VRVVLPETPLYVRRRLALRRVRRLARPVDQTVAGVLRAVELALRGELEPDEKEWVRRIERIRRRLCDSREPVTLTDFGAVPADSAAERRAAQEDDAPSGVVVTQTVGERCRSSTSPLAALLLFRFVRELRPYRCLELGTNLGVSAAYQAAALRLNGGGELHTIEGAGSLAQLSRANLESLQLASVEVYEGRFTDVLPAVLARTEPLDYAFVDGHHDGPATVGYFARLHPSLRPGALVVFDDIAWSAGMAEAWTALEADRRVRASVNLGGMGVCVVGGDGERFRVDLPIPG